MDKTKHLEFIQAIIARLSNSSFAIKGWTLTVCSAIYALAATNSNWRVAAITVIPAILFWILDGLFLRQERLYRCLYDDVRVESSTVEPFLLSARAYKANVKVRSVILSATLVIFYGSLLIASVALAILLSIR